MHRLRWYHRAFLLLCFQVLHKMLELTAESYSWKSSGSEFQTVGLSTEKNGFQACCGNHVEQIVDDAWRIIEAGNQELQTQAHSSWRDMLEPWAKDNDGPSWWACTASYEEQSASVSAVSDCACNSESQWSEVQIQNGMQLACNSLQCRSNT